MWRRWRWIVVPVLLLGMWMLAPHLDPRQREWNAMDRQFSACGQASSFACVVDGDTLRIGSRPIRLTGFDAPEMEGDCDAERRLARVSRDELTAWLNLGPFEMDGGEEAPRDAYGRELRGVRRGGEALADTMIERGLARRSGFAKDWCG